MWSSDKFFLFLLQHKLNRISWEGYEKTAEDGNKEDDTSYFILSH